MALSCIYRCEQKFGALHIIDVLRGTDNEKIRQFGHQHLSTYGIGKHLSVNEWRSIFRQIVARGYVDVEMNYGSLRLHESCRPILRGEQKIELRKDLTPVKSKPEKKARQALGHLEEADLPLWAALKKCRKEIADEHGVPPYVIFHDATLRELVEYRPLTFNDMLKINGVGERKLEQYGQAFLDVLKDFESGLKAYPD